MAAMAQQRVHVQRQWTDQELMADGFLFYRPVKRVTMVRRPVEPDIFAETYRPWDTPNWQPTPTEAHLQRLGCQPYYKITGVWAKQLAADTWVQDIESAEPALSPKGDWLCVGMEGEPWSMTESWFQTHYLLPGSKNSEVHKG